MELEREEKINIIADALKRFQKDNNLVIGIEDYEQLAENYLNEIEQNPDLTIGSVIDIDKKYSKITYKYEGSITLQNGRFIPFIADIAKFDDSEIEFTKCKLKDRLENTREEELVEDFIIEKLLKSDSQ